MVSTHHANRYGSRSSQFSDWGHTLARIGEGSHELEKNARRWVGPARRLLSLCQGKTVIRGLQKQVRCIL